VRILGEWDEERWVAGKKGKREGEWESNSPYECREGEKKGLWCSCMNMHASCSSNEDEMTVKKKAAPIFSSFSASTC
jgi:hypothetical protein